jgi:hypothetical protein
LNLSVSAVRWRWAKVFSHIAQIRPDLIDMQKDSTRGPTKRNRILQYVREHPEELRPWKK